MTDIRGYIINLDRSPERLPAMDAQLHGLQLPYERIAAFDAANVTMDMALSMTAPRLGTLFKNMARYHYIAETGPMIFWPEIGRYLVAGEIACYLSHSLSLEAFLASGADAAVIFEDDVEVDPDVAEVIKAVADLPSEPRIVKLEGVQASYQANYPVARTSKREIIMMLKPTTGAAAYYINRAAANQIVPKLFPIREPFDAFLRQYWLHGVDVLEARPFPVRQRNLGTTIPGRDDQKRAALPLSYATLRSVCIPALKMARFLHRIIFLAKSPDRLVSLRTRGTRGASKHIKTIPSAN
jgi:glycosyl transferase family 25